MTLLALLIAAAVTTAAGPLDVPAFDYPPAALKSGEHGRVGYIVTITARGKVRHCRVTQSSGFTRLDHATCSVLKRATAAPAAADGQPVDSDRAGVLNWAVVAPVTLPPSAPTATPPPPR